MEQGGGLADHAVGPLLQVTERLGLFFAAEAALVLGEVANDERWPLVVVVSGINRTLNLHGVTGAVFAVVIVAVAGREHDRGR